MSTMIPPPFARLPLRVRRCLNRGRPLILRELGTLMTLVLSATGSPAAAQPVAVDSRVLETARSMAGSGSDAAAVAREMTSRFRQTGEQATAILIRVGYPAQAVATVALGDVKAAPTELGRWLVREGAPAPFLVEALSASGEKEPRDAALFLARSDVPVDLAVRVLVLLQHSAARPGVLARDIGEAVARGTLMALTGAGYAATDVIEAMREWYADKAALFLALYELDIYSVEGLVELGLTTLGLAPERIAQGVVERFEDSDVGRAIRALVDLGGMSMASAAEYVLSRLSDTVEALKALVGDVAHLVDGIRVLRAMLEAGHDPAEVAGAAVEALKVDAEELARVLRETLRDAVAVARALSEALDLDPAELAEIMRRAGYSAEETAAALAEVQGQGAEEVARALHAAGYAASEVEAALRATFELTLEMLLRIIRAVLGGDVWGSSA